MIIIANSEGQGLDSETSKKFIAAGNRAIKLPQSSNGWYQTQNWNWILWWLLCVRVCYFDEWLTNFFIIFPLSCVNVYVCVCPPPLPCVLSVNGNVRESIHIHKSQFYPRWQLWCCQLPPMLRCAVPACACVCGWMGMCTVSAIFFCACASRVTAAAVAATAVPWESCAQSFFHSNTLMTPCHPNRWTLNVYDKWFDGSSGSRCKKKNEHFFFFFYQQSKTVLWHNICCLLLDNIDFSLELWTTTDGKYAWYGMRRRAFPFFSYLLPFIYRFSFVDYVLFPIRTLLRLLVSLPLLLSVYNTVYTKRMWKNSLLQCGYL